ncbi:MAG: hypothetical protein ABSF77_08215 [Spirochaetia bacterium]
MKKLMLVLIIAIVPVLAFAQFQIGATAVYGGSVSSLTSSSSLSTSDFVFGLESRLKLWIFQGGVTALYYPEYQSVDLLTDVGLSLNIWFIRIGLGAGPNFGFDTAGGSDMTDAGWNMKATVDINIGGLSIGVVGYVFSDNLSDLIQSVAGSENSPTTLTPALGVTVLFKIF